MNVHQYFTGDIRKHDAFIRTVVLDVLTSEIEIFLDDAAKHGGLTASFRAEVLRFISKDFAEALKYAFENPADVYLESVRFCDNCGEPMRCGYVVNDGEEHCCEICARDDDDINDLS